MNAHFLPSVYTHALAVYVLVFLYLAISEPLFFLSVVSAIVYILDSAGACAEPNRGDVKLGFRLFLPALFDGFLILSVLDSPIHVHLVRRA